MKEKLYAYKEAAVYCGISETEFLTHTNEKATLAYRLVLGQRLYTQSELDKFKTEILGQKVKR